MRRLMTVGLVLVVGTTAVAAGAAAKQRVKVSVTVYSATHCGGAAPRPDEPMGTTGPGSGAQFNVRSGRKNVGQIIATATAGTDGTFSLSLAPGTYCLADASKPSGPVMPQQYRDADCLEHWQESCDAIIKVPATRRVAVQLQHGCFGVCYRGPLPP